MRPADYIRSDRRGRAAHDMEAEALRDPLLAEALEGLDTVDGDHAAAVESLRRRIACRTRPRGLRPALRQLAAIAALAALLLTGGYLLTHRPAIPEAVSEPPAELRTEVPGSSDLLAEDSGPADLPAADPMTPPPPRHPALPTPTESQATAPETPRRALPDRTAAQPSDTTAGPVTADTPAEEHFAEPEEAVVLAYGTNRKQEFVGSVRIRGSKSAAADDKEQPSLTAERMPTFRGGTLSDFRRWVEERLETPQLALTCGIPSRAVLSFVIDTAGCVTDIRTLQNPDSTLTAEAVRIVRSSPRWEPGTRAGRKVPMKIILPVDFRLQAPPSPGRTLEKWVRTRLTYPEQLRKRGIAGRVTASVTIDTAGYVAAVAILDSPHPQLTREVLRLLRRAPRQTPVRRRGEAVEEQFLLTFDFPDDR